MTPPEVKFTIEGAASAGALFPDGTQIAYRELVGQEALLVVRSLTSGARKPLPDVGEVGTGSIGSSIFWSPDGTSIAFFSGQKLKRLDVASGALQTLADAPTPRGGAWAADGTILFAPAGNGPLYRVRAAGGETQPLTELQASETSHRDPQFLPDGKTFIFWVGGPAGVRGVYLASLDRRAGTRLLDADGPAAFAAPNHVLFVRDGVLSAQRFDRATSSMIGDPVAVAAGLSASQTAVRAVSASTNGVITYRLEADDPKQVQWVDRSGRVLEKLGEPLSWMGAAEIAPDGQTIAFAQSRHGRGEIWMMELPRGTVTRFNADAYGPSWSPDGSKRPPRSHPETKGGIGTVRLRVRHAYSLFSAALSPTISASFFARDQRLSCRSRVRAAARLTCCST